jgi:nitrogen fixation protein FixH
MVVIATHDEGFAVEADYYQKATQWDELQSAQRASDALGWRAHVQLTKSGANTLVDILLSDAADTPLSVSQVQVRMFPNAHAEEVHDLTLVETGRGHYLASFPNARTGLWEVRVEATGTSGERFLQTSRVDVEVWSR